LELREVPVDTIRPNPHQPRVDFEKESLQELADSFKKRGVLEPIIVRKHGNTFEIVAGERRWRAAKIAGFREIPAIVRTVSEEDVLIESLMENIHRTNLTDVERENAIYELWKSGGFKTKSEMANALCLREKPISDDIDAWGFRRNNNVKESVPTYIIARTSGLEREERKGVVKRFENGEFRAIDVYSVVKTIKKASGPLKKELLSSKSSITPEIAEIIVENLPNPSDQSIVVGEIKHRRPTANEVKNLVTDIQQDRNIEVVSEIDTGYLFKCPVCNRVYRIFHNEPTDTHSLKEMS